ncbi:MAG TPA: LacI family transcriptional regulator [Firmicutes bacterium]|jgi:DNA-binding LacI/PurR family transcriptional regulator|nr:LacI family transcriptional regulator [Bacillota bacterium]
MPTIKDVAKRAGVSVATVSAVINRDSGVKVSKKLTEKVEEAIKELNYRPNRIARALSRKQTQTIAYVVPTVNNTFFSQMAQMIENQAFEKKYGVYLCNTHSMVDRVELYKDILIENRVGGVITTLTWDIIENGLIEAMQEEEIPIIGLAGARVIDGIDTITFNDVGGAELATRHLLAKGHQKIGFIGIEESKTTEQRLKGYKKALNDANLELDEKYIERGKSFSREEGYALAQKLCQRAPEMSAIFVYNDVMAAGVLDSLNNLGLRIPQDVAVVGYDNSVASYTRPKLTTMDLFKEKMVEEAMELLFKRIAREEFEPRHEEILPRLVIGEST